MIENLTVLGLVTARGGSKGVVRKNLIQLQGYSLTELAIINLQKCPFIDKIILSSDDKEIIDSVSHLGDYVPFIRPPELASDTSKSLDVIKHTIQFEMSHNRFYDLIALAEPSCPFRLPAHFTTGLQLIVSDPSITSVVSLIRVGDKHPIRMKKLLPDGKLLPFYEEEPEGIRRQEQEPLYIRNGGAYIFRSSEILNDRLYGNHPFGFEVDQKKFGINIDEETDAMLAQLLVNEYLKRDRLDEILPLE